MSVVVVVVDVLDGKEMMSFILVVYSQIVFNIVLTVHPCDCHLLPLWMLNAELEYCYRASGISVVQNNQK